jgi:hypothetical protein
MGRFLWAQRPSKHVQRRMVVDACRRLRSFAPLDQYRYVGFGAYEFVDFELFRRELGIVEMHSIEGGEGEEEGRFTFNRPFGEVSVHFGRASDLLPDILDDAVLRIVWLDYLSSLSAEVLQDVGTCGRMMIPGSVLIVTINARPPQPKGERRRKLIEAVGPERVAPEMIDENLDPPGFARAQREILAQEVRSWMSRRDDGSSFRQLFNIRYDDGTPMLTWGGLIVAPGMHAALENACFHELEQTSDGEHMVDATVHPLTTREVLHLNSQLPTRDATGLSGQGIPEEALQSYERLYRWYPTVPAPM